MASAKLYGAKGLNFVPCHFARKSDYQPRERQLERKFPASTSHSTAVKSQGCRICQDRSHRIKLFDGRVGVQRGYWMGSNINVGGLLHL